MKSRKRCKECGAVDELKPTGRPKTYCSDRCRKAAQRKRGVQSTIDDFLSQQGDQ